MTGSNQSTDIEFSAQITFDLAVCPSSSTTRSIAGPCLSQFRWVGGVWGRGAWGGGGGRGWGEEGGGKKREPGLTEQRYKNPEVLVEGQFPGTEFRLEHSAGNTIFAPKELKASQGCLGDPDLFVARTKTVYKTSVCVRLMKY